MVDALSDISATQRMESARRPVAWWPVGLTASAATLLLLITSGGYDYHRDELYLRLLAEHLRWGYADQPPLTPILVRFGIATFGDTVWAIRVAPAVLLGLTAIVAALIAREAGGGRAAQWIAAAAVFSTFPLSAAHVTSTAAVDLLIWLGVIFFVVRALLWRDQRAWIGAGVVAGIGLWNEHLVVLLLVCLAAGLLPAGSRCWSPAVSRTIRWLCSWVSSRSGRCRWSAGSPGGAAGRHWPVRRRWWCPPGSARSPHCRSSRRTSWPGRCRPG
ncbi:ArnT family glycosyltransferase [Actinoplanes sp. G11-F43]|uniref:ArnT family glycosyltransferase n=1 Tax=Actinoplanes sp. G11-F43 TaxID=3424130 RepID=UPI003D3483B7